jgi:hypothetical protein
VVPRQPVYRGGAGHGLPIRPPQAWAARQHPRQAGLYGIADVATLTGLFSRHALNKLRDIFDVAFASNGRRDPQERPNPSDTELTANGSRPVTPSTPVPPASTPQSTSPGQATQLASDGATPGGTG